MSDSAAKAVQNASKWRRGDRIVQIWPGEPYINISAAIRAAAAETGFIPPSSSS